MPSKTQSIVLGAVVAVVVGTLLNIVIANAGTTGLMIGGCTACLLIFIGPLVAVWHYTSTHSLTLTAGEGAGIGALTGVAGSALGWAVTYVLRLADVLPTAAEAQRQAAEAFGADPSQLPDQSGSFLSTPIGELLVGLVMGAILGAIGGAIGAAIFKKGDPLDDEV